MITEQNKYADIQQYVNYDNRASRGDQSPVQKEIMRLHPQWMKAHLKMMGEEHKKYSIRTLHLLFSSMSLSSSPTPPPTHTRTHTHSRKH